MERSYVSFITKAPLVTKKGANTQKEDVNLAMFSKARIADQGQRTKPKLKRKHHNVSLLKVPPQKVFFLI